MAARDERLRILSSLRDAMTASLSVFDRARAAGGSAKNGAEAVNTAITQFDVGYEDVKRRSTAHQAPLNELAQVEARREGRRTARPNTSVTDGHRVIPSRPTISYVIS